MNYITYKPESEGGLIQQADPQGCQQTGMSWGDLKRTKGLCISYTH